LKPLFKQQKKRSAFQGEFKIIQTFVNIKIIVPMAIGLFKWLMIAVLNVIHPFHISTTEINHNASDKTFEISCKVFTDDLESVLTKQYHTKADLSAITMKAAMDTLVKKYINSHLTVNADGKTLGMKYLGFEKENEAIYAYLQVDNISTVKKIVIANSILYDLYDDQISIIHVIVGGNRKSTKLDYPANKASFEF
jgi:hypothetical protein